MNIVSVQVGLPRRVTWKGKDVTTGIFKEPVDGPVMVRTLNLDGDRQADLSVHGGTNKAVYLYPSEHYPWWRQQLPEMQLPHGMFGENLTTAGLLEQDLHVGDRFRLGGAEVVVTQPRMPCFKLAIRFGRDDIIRRFLESGRSGFYVAVLREGEVQAGDAIERIARGEGRASIADVFRSYARR
jgi:MOSC domain-containing protein YiiM